ncbi:hypothetical protein D0C36_19045 [Mucilaginibacter conchicola]|uniref:Uncharacterized protein n=1 Tax=Mucilaginibacter conchicola TaxID=2303333 RepID=A0A372NQ29_9SPHI|nr:hypothetical protein D0C36_19045 [Mucilaginibacter conchicola]
MKFPITVVFKRKLNIIVDRENVSKILSYIRDEIIKRKADNVIMGDMHVSYKDTIAPSRGSLFGDYLGDFSFCHETDQWYLSMN